MIQVILDNPDDSGYKPAWTHYIGRDSIYHLSMLHNPGGTLDDYDGKLYIVDINPPHGPETTSDDHRPGLFTIHESTIPGKPPVLKFKDSSNDACERLIAGLKVIKSSRNQMNSHRLNFLEIKLQQY